MFPSIHRTFIENMVTTTAQSVLSFGPNKRFVPMQSAPTFSNISPHLKMKTNKKKVSWDFNLFTTTFCRAYYKPQVVIINQTCLILKCQGFRWVVISCLYKCFSGAVLIRFLSLFSHETGTFPQFHWMLHCITAWVPNVPFTKLHGRKVKFSRALMCVK